MLFLKYITEKEYGKMCKMMNSTDLLCQAWKRARNAISG